MERSLDLLGPGAENSFAYIRTLANLGSAYAAARRGQEAMLAAARAARLAEMSFGFANPAAGPILEECSIVMKRSGNKSEAKRLREQADQIRRTYPGQDSHRSVVDMADLLPRRR